jgi:hypothetical protein
LQSAQFIQTIRRRMHAFRFDDESYFNIACLASLIQWTATCLQSWCFFFHFIRHNEGLVAILRFDRRDYWWCK